MRRLIAALAAALALPFLAPAPAAACAPDQPACEVDGGGYRIRLPDGPGPHPAVLYLHGHGGSGRHAIANDRRVGAFLRAGYAVIGPDGDRWRGPASPRGWNAMASPRRRDDVAFLQAVAADATRRFGLERSRMLAAGFSSGGMMTWRLACDAPRAFAAFVPLSGTFWRPVPATCAGPAPVLHIHGTTDRVVPVEGRSLAGGRLVQGDVRQVLALRGAEMGCAEAPGPTARLGPVPAEWEAREWAGCAPGGALVYVTWPGGHDAPAGWAEAALRFVSSLGAQD